MNSTTNIQLQQILNKQGIHVNVCSKDELGNNPQGRYIINMENHDKGSGTHWTACLFLPNEIYWMDSFGVLPPIEIEQCRKGRPLYYNKKDLQDYNSSSCGWFCVAFHLYVKDYLSYCRFVDCFSFNSVVNDSILKELLKSKNINC